MKYLATILLLFFSTLILFSQEIRTYDGIRYDLSDDTGQDFTKSVEVIITPTDISISPTPFGDLKFTIEFKVENGWKVTQKHNPSVNFKNCYIKLYYKRLLIEGEGDAKRILLINKQ